MKPLFITFILSILICLSSVSSADNFDDALQATAVGDYKKAYQLWLIEAEKGSARAQTNLGLMHGDGLGVPQNDKQAVKWYRMAARQGEKRAQYYLGTMLENGLGVPQDYKDAAENYRLAAGQGHIKAQYRLGLLYLKGQGVVQSSESAYAWWSVAASKGHEDAQKYKDSADQQMTPQQIETAQRIAKQIWVELGY